MAPNKDVSRFFRHSAIYAIGNAMNRLGAFVLLPLYTHYLSAAEYGTLEVFYAISSVVSGILSVGIAHATLRFYFECTNDSERQALVCTNLIASTLISLVGVSILWLFGPNFDAGYPLMFILAISLVARAAVGPAERLLNMLGEQRRCAWVYATVFALNLAGCIAVAGPYGSVGVAIVISATCVVESVLLFLIAKRRLGLHMLVWPRASV